MQTIVYLPEPDEWESAIPCTFVWRTVDYYWDLVKIIQAYERNSVKYGSRLSAWNFLSLYGDIMPRPEKKKNGTATNGQHYGSGASGDVKWQWVNCRLSNADISALERDESTVEYLVTCLVALGNDGFGFTCKPVDEGKSQCCTIYRPDHPSVGRTVGVSAFGGSLRDAVLTCLYKLDNYCGGDFTGIDDQDVAESAKPRFR